MPLDWQSVVTDVLAMKKRIKFGISIMDRDLSEKEKLAVECCQDAIDKKQQE